MRAYLVALTADVGQTVCSDTEFVRAPDAKTARKVAKTLWESAAYWERIGYQPARNVRVLDCEEYQTSDAPGSAAWCETNGDNH